jgi:hypothetical protein
MMPRLLEARRAAARAMSTDRAVGRAVRRALNLWRYRAGAARRPLPALRYLVSGRELTNFTYDISNTRELVAVVAAALELPAADVEKLVREVVDDEEFTAGLRACLRGRRDREDEPRFGRRLGWYCVVRARRPAVVVETGSHDGLGTALLARALARNAADGSPGVVLSFDMDPSSGWLVDESLQPYVERHIGDARETLPAALADGRVGVFVHDSLHTYDHERFELETALARRDDEIVLISDNSHESTALPDVCAASGLRYFFFREQPLDHFYPGAGMGLGV